MTEKEDEIRWLEYLYPGTNVLKNKYNCKDYIKLKEIEVNITFEKLVELRKKKLYFVFDKNYLKEIHRYLFNDIYDFAGQYRKVNLTKAKGNFLNIQDESDFDEYLDQLFNSINQELNNCYSKYQFCDILSKLYTKLIYCHPFREGNGRSIREFIREFSIAESQERGFGKLELDWKLIDKDSLNQYIEVAHLFPGLTTEIFNNALVPVNVNTPKTI